MPKPLLHRSSSSSSGSSSKKITISIAKIVLILLVGFLLGFFSPVRLYRKGSLLSFIAETDT
jgi:hypothetical protein